MGDNKNSSLNPLRKVSEEITSVSDHVKVNVKGFHHPISVSHIEVNVELCDDACGVAVVSHSLSRIVSKQVPKEVYFL